jgi:hypothetical protein
VTAAQSAAPDRSSATIRISDIGVYQRPFQSGLRFSAKAFGPSMVSSLRVMAT